MPDHKILDAPDDTLEASKYTASFFEKVTLRAINVSSLIVLLICFSAIFYSIIPFPIVVFYGMCIFTLSGFIGTVAAILGMIKCRRIFNVGLLWSLVINFLFTLPAGYFIMSQFFGFF